MAAMKRNFLVLITILLAMPAFAQQLPLYTLYREHNFIINPAIAGSEDRGSVNASYRYQWTKIEGAPQTMSASYRTPIPKYNLGVGGHVVNDKTGPTSYTGLTGAVSYHIDFRKINPFSWAKFLRKSHIAVGLSFSVSQYRLNSSELLLDQPNDALINSSNNTRFTPNAGMGIYYYYDKFYLGYSAPSLIPLNVNFSEGGTISNLKREMHHYIVVGGKIPLGKDYQPKLTLEPMAWFRTVKGAPFQVDGYLRLRYKNLFWVGTGFRSSMTLLADAGFIIGDKIQIGYAYDQQLNDVRSFTGSTHEVVLSYLFRPVKKKTKRI